MPTTSTLSARRAARALAALGLLLAAGVLARYLPAVAPWTARASAAVVAFGDSLTEGAGFARQPWPEVLAERLRRRERGSPVRVVNAGISGNRLLRAGSGPSGVERFQRDALDVPGTRWVIVLEGVNDLGFPGSVEPEASLVTAEQLIAGYRQLIARARAAGVKIYGGTLPPFEGTVSPGYHSRDKELARQAVNAWLRSSGEFDAIIDFDQTLRDPHAPTRLRPEYDSGDHLHPGQAGHRAMGEAIDLRLFEESAPRDR